jgi:hypothetical protein
MGSPSESAFCRIAPAERFSVRAIDATGVFFLECPLSALTSPLVHARRLDREDFLLIAFFAMSIVSLTLALPASTKQPAIRKLVSELFEEGLRDVRVKSLECQGLINNFTRCNPGKCCKIINRRCRMATPSCFCRRQKMGDIEQQQHVLTSFVQKSIFATAQL